MKFRTILLIIIPLILILAIFEDAEKNGTYDDQPIPCTITGVKKGENLVLKLTYDGMTIPNITGKLEKKGSFTANVKSKSYNAEMTLPSKSSKANLSTQTFMSYTAVTAKSSAQYKLLNSSGAKDSGIYRKMIINIPLRWEAFMVAR